MSITVSPLSLLLDDENPRFVVLNSREQTDIRKYMVTYEDVCELAVGINDYGGILPGERIVVLARDDKYVVIEGNRRTCSLQMLLDPTLIPEGFRHRIPAASEKLRESCQAIEADIVPSRDAALELMTKRHIEGVKQWKPLAKKQFSASNYDAGLSVSNLSRITGMRESDIKSDIRDYKFFLSAYNDYCSAHSDYQGMLVDLKIDPFLRVFKAKFLYKGIETKPVDALKISYTDTHDTISELPQDIFKRIVQKVFEEAVISERINTRNTLEDVTGIIDELEALEQAEGRDANSDNSASDNSSTNGATPPNGTSPGKQLSGGSTPGNAVSGNTPSGGSTPDTSTTGTPAPGGPAPGGPAPRTFFESLAWSGKLSPDNPEHTGLLATVHELYNSSRFFCKGKRVYEMFPIATGMILRTAYEQVLKLRLIQVNLWGNFMAPIASQGRFPTLSAMESFVDSQANRDVVLPSAELKSAFSLIKSYRHREFLNANIHNPGDIRVTPESLSAIAQGGMFTLIQGLINLL